MKTDIITFSEKLIQRLKENNVLDETNDFNATGKTISTIRDLLSELRKFVLTYQFNSEAEEIRFFKEIKPVLLSQYFYYHKKFSILMFDSFRDAQSRMANYDKVLHKMQRYAFRNKDFYQYCVSAQNGSDNLYFIRNKFVNIEIGFDEIFSTGYDSILSRLLANELLKEFIAKRKHSLDPENQSLALLKWTDSKVALIELIYALDASGTINHNKGEIKPIVTAFQQLFDIDLGNYARVFAEIRMRKNSQTTFLDRIRENLLNRIDEFDK